MRDGLVFKCLCPLLATEDCVALALDFYCVCTFTGMTRVNGTLC